MKKLFDYSMTIVASISVASLATCGIVEGIKEDDGTKILLTCMWLVTIAQYLVWKRRALIEASRAKDFINFMLRITDEPPNEVKDTKNATRVIVDD